MRKPASESIHSLRVARDRGAALELELDGEPLHAYAGESVGAALLASGIRGVRGAEGEERGVFCGMGVCFECLVEIDGVPNQRACQVIVRSGMRIRRQGSVRRW